MAIQLKDLLDARVDELRKDTRGEPMPEPPSMSSGNPERCAVSLYSSAGDLVTAGDGDEAFTIQSISKAMTYAMALQAHGHQEVHRHVDVEPSGEAYHVIAVDDVSGKPDNPMVNTGALVVHSLVPGADADERFAVTLETMSRMAGRQLAMDEDVYREEMASTHRNLAIAHLLRAKDILQVDPHEVVDGYTRQCSVLVTVEDLATMAGTLAAGGVQPTTGERVFSQEVVRQVLSVMLTCGMYDDAGDWVSGVGIPAKSGVAGGILAVAPGRLGIGAWSPRLDDHGTSVRGRELVRGLAQKLELHLLDGRPATKLDWDARESVD